MSKVLLGFTLGLITGLLIAPDKGSESRKKLERTGRDLKNKFNDFVDYLNDKWESFTADVSDMASETKNEAKSSAGTAWQSP